MVVRRILLWGLCSIVLAVLGLGLYMYLSLTDGTAGAMLLDEDMGGTDSAAAADSTIPSAFAEMFSAEYTFDTTAGAGGQLMIDTSYKALPRAQAPGGRKVSIAVCGVDSRMNERVEHADANHVITVWLDSGMVDIVSIPRDTPCDAGFPGGSRLNILANVRARKGRDAYLQQVASIAGVGKVDYYVDLGFSQARGVLELLGFGGGQSNSALRVLRARQAFDAGDFQRCFNQAQFMRQMLLAKFDKLDGLSGDLLVRGGLCLVTTDLTYDAVDSIAGALRTAGFPKNRESVNISIKPAYYAKMAVFNFGDSAVLGSLLNRINRKAAAHGIGGDDSTMIRFRAGLNGLLAKAAGDTARTPVRTIALLRRCFEQRIWWQLPEVEERGRVRDRMGELLAHAYTKTGRVSDAEAVRGVLRFEQELNTARAKEK